MSDYEVIFGLDCVGGDQAPIDCAVVKTSDGKPGIMLDGEVFTKESLTPEPAGGTKVLVSGDESYSVGDVPFSEDGYAFCEPGDIVSGLNEEYHYYISAIDPETLNIVYLEQDVVGITSYTIPDTSYLMIFITIA